MGGHDPYSASKGAAELIIASYRRSFFPVEHYGKSHGTLLASCRAGNVIGGGDWSEDRLIPDIVRATTRDEAVTIRAPHSIRPWQHVLDALGAYLLLGNQLLDGESAYAGAWNFGPDDDTMTVREVCESVRRLWPETRFRFMEEHNGRHEANTLRLDCSKARSLLGWRNRWGTSESIEKTVLWYRAFLEHGRLLSQTQIEEWMNHG
jgi:CDP-glucose 4,6-dehydratase